MRRALVPKLDAARFADVTALVTARSGMVFAPNRRVEAEAGIARSMKDAGITGIEAYLAVLARDRLALDDLVDTLTVGETHFMRDPQQMALIRSEVVPDLRRRRDSGFAPRVWSAGCATGEEAYSLAILLEQEGLAEGAFILGSDISNVALDKARVGSYSDWSMRGLDEPFLQDYFRRASKRRVLIDRIRTRVSFLRLNLVGPEEYEAAGASDMDLILCRNVLIYFDRETAARIAARLYACLAEGGVLLTGGGDLMLAEFAPFDVEVTRAGLIYRRHGRTTRPRKVLPLPRPAAHTDARDQARSAARAPAPALPAPAPAPPPPPAPSLADPGREAFSRVLTHANVRGAKDAERVAVAALRRHPLDAHLHYLRATLLLALGRDDDAEESAQRAIFLERSLAVAHFLLGTILRKRGAHQEALRAFRNSRDLSAVRPPDEEVPAGAGERMGALHSAAAAEMERLTVTLG